MIQTVKDIENASDAVLRAFLKAEGAAFSEDAGHDELVAEARVILTTTNAKNGKVEKKQTVKKEEGLVVPEDTSDQEVLRTFQARGFTTKEEIIAYMNALEREKAEMKTQREALEATVADIELRELQFAEREKELNKKAESVHADIAVQKNLYEKISGLKASLPAGTDITGL